VNDEIRVNKAVRVIPQKQSLKQGKKKEQEEHKHKDEAGDHFQQLSKAAEFAHDTLKRDYRFSIYQEGEEVFIDIVIVDEDGTVKETKKMNITHEEFTTWLNHIEQGNGLFFDITA
jgi:uncharacterized FlaG/YvyC family protein